MESLNKKYKGDIIVIYKTITNYKEATKDFLENEKQFHLGVITTEQSNPITKNLSATIMKDTAQGVKTIFKADKFVVWFLIVTWQFFICEVVLNNDKEK